MKIWECRAFLARRWLEIGLWNIQSRTLARATRSTRIWIEQSSYDGRAWSFSSSNLLLACLQRLLFEVQDMLPFQKSISCIHLQWALFVSVCVLEMFRLHRCKFAIIIFPLRSWYWFADHFGVSFPLTYYCKEIIRSTFFLIPCWLWCEKLDVIVRSALACFLNIPALFENYAKSNHLFGNCIYQHENDLLPDYCHTWISEEANTLLLLNWLLEAFLIFIPPSHRYFEKIRKGEWHF